MAGVETCVGPSGSAGTSSAVSGAIRLESCGISVSSISTTFGGEYLALPYPLLGDRHFLPAPYLEFPSLLLIVQHPLLVITLVLHLNHHPLLGFLRIQLDGCACL